MTPIVIPAYVNIFLLLDNDSLSKWISDFFGSFICGVQYSTQMEFHKKFINFFSKVIFSNRNVLLEVSFKIKIILSDKLCFPSIVSIIFFLVSMKIPS